MTDRRKFTAQELADCADRELRQRERVYPRLVQGGKMTANFAREQEAMMRQIRDEYRTKAEGERLL